ncbi:MAG: SMC-Scp complex subunit ScpB [Planctomycetaceae bacterium]|nr:SMC-Scp complex subunit ScpB [Planctomycetaceae bacterium]
MATFAHFHFQLQRVTATHQAGSTWYSSCRTRAGWCGISSHPVASEWCGGSAGEWLRFYWRLSAAASSDRESDQQVLSDGGLIRTHRMAALEAALLISDGPVTARRLAQIARLIDAQEARELLDQLNEAYDREQSAFRIEQTAAGYMMMTRPLLSPWLDRLHHRQAQLTLSPPMMETLTIIAYQQPVTRADVESIRGVQSAEMIRQLIDRGLIRVGGEDDSLGRPFLYVTTRQFLSLYGLQKLEDLPNYEALKRHHLQLVSDDEPENADEDSVLDAADETRPGESGDSNFRRPETQDAA